MNRNPKLGNTKLKFLLICFTKKPVTQLKSKELPQRRSQDESKSPKPPTTSTIGVAGESREVGLGWLEFVVC